jgi:hypothetical protein
MIAVFCSAGFSIRNRDGRPVDGECKMNSLNMKLILSSLGIVAMLTSPAFAKKPHQVTYNNGSAVYNTIPGYDRDGDVVGIPNSDQSNAQWQR